ncbi:MAG: DUF4177 domain-containing protein [Limisphaerales bacterium]
MNTHWDYKTLTVRAKGMMRTTADAEALERELRGLGESGWELVALVAAVHGGGGLVAVL